MNLIKIWKTIQQICQHLYKKKLIVFMNIKWIFYRFITKSNCDGRAKIWQGIENRLLLNLWVTCFKMVYYNIDTCLL